MPENKSNSSFKIRIREDIVIDNKRLIDIQRRILKIMGENFICEENADYNIQIINVAYGKVLASKDEGKLKRYFLLKKLAADIIDSEFLFDKKTLELIKNEPTPKNLSKEEIEFVNANILHMDMLLFSGTTVYILEETLIKEISDELILSLLFLTSKAIIQSYNEITTHKLLNSKSFKKILELSRKKLSLIKELIIPNNFKYLPNKKYTFEMFEYTVKQHLFNHKTKKRAILETAEAFPGKITSLEGYAKQYDKHLNKKTGTKLPLK